MSDSKLRELERRWKETGAVEDEAAYLLERVRAGDLTQERLELAAYCGHEAAGCAVSLPRSSWDYLRLGMQTASSESSIRTAAALGRSVLVSVDGKGMQGVFGDDFDLVLLEGVLIAIDAWILNPSFVNAQALTAWAGPSSERMTVDPCADLAWAISTTVEHPRGVLTVMERARGILEEAGTPFEFVVAALNSILCPWLLTRQDSV